MEEHEDSCKHKKYTCASEYCSKEFYVEEKHNVKEYYNNKMKDKIQNKIS